MQLLGYPLYYYLRSNSHRQILINDKIHKELGVNPNANYMEALSSWS